MTRMIDRLLRRALPPGATYSENYYTGAEYVPGSPVDEAKRERADQALVRQARRAYRENGIVFACLATRQALFAEARFLFQSAIDNHLFGNQDLALLEHPWPNASTGELLARMCGDASMGNSYIRKAVPEGGDPVLVSIPQQQVTIISEELTDAEGRTWRQPVGYMEDRGPGADPQFYTTDEVAHFSPVPDPDARWRGMSFLTPLLKEVGADSKLTEYKSFHLEHGAMPGLVVKYSVKLSNPTIDKLRKRFRARYGGPENAGNVLVLDEGADLQVAGSTLEQLQFEAVSKVGERRIAAAAGPGLLVITGLESGDYQSAIRQLGDLWARPWWRMVCSSLEHLVPTSSNIGPVRLWYDVSGIAALREGELQRAQSFLVKAQGLASTVAAGFSRESAVQAADSGDLSLLKADPQAAPPGAPAGGQQKLGAPAGGPGQPPTGGPANGNGRRPPQAGRPQQLPGVGTPNLPNALPGGFGAMPALPAGGPRGRQGRRAEDVNGDGELVLERFTWREALHPRDLLGMFTSGHSSEHAAEDHALGERVSKLEERIGTGLDALALNVGELAFDVGRGRGRGRQVAFGGAMSDAADAARKGDHARAAAHLEDALDIAAEADAHARQLRPELNSPVRKHLGELTAMIHSLHKSAGARAAEAHRARKPWDPDLHPRVMTGEHGGEFAPKAVPSVGRLANRRVTMIGEPASSPLWRKLDKILTQPKMYLRGAHAGQQRRPALPPYKESVARVRDQILATIKHEDTLAAGKAWYPEERARAVRRAHAYGVSVPQAAGVVAATSPRASYAINQRVTSEILDAVPRLRKAADPVRRARGGVMGTFRDDGVRIALGESIDANLTGTKRRSFFNNIMFPGQTDDVTVDTWMYDSIAQGLGLTHDQAASMGYEKTKDFPDTVGYMLAADATRQAARRLGVSPDEAQAAYWIGRQQSLGLLNPSAHEGVSTRGRTRGRQVVASV